jgi:hypothetical protein
VLIDAVAPFELVEKIVRPKLEAVVDGGGVVFLLEARDAFAVLLCHRFLSRPFRLRTTTPNARCV